MLKNAIWAAGAAAVALSGFAPVAEASHGCPKSGVVKRTRDAVVVKRERRGEAENPRYYGCALRYGNTYRLNRPSDHGGANGLTFIDPEDIRLSGRMVAYQEDFGGPGEEGCSCSITVRNLRDGKVIHSAGAVGPDEGSARSLVVKRNGSAAWIAIDAFTEELSVFLVDRTTEKEDEPPSEDKPRLLDQGEGINPDSLKLASDRMTVVWTAGGERRSAPIG